MIPDNDRLDRADKALESLALKQRYDERNRVTLLLVHAVGGFFAGLFIITDEPPTAWVDRFGPGEALPLGGPPLVGGLLLAFGLAMRYTSAPSAWRFVIEAVGMLGILAWSLVMIWVISGSGNAVYPVAVYADLAGLMLVHFATLAAYLWRRQP